MMILQAVPRSDSSGIGYTWDESWILPYESIWSLVHKFAMLNRISLADCKTLFKPESNKGEGITELGCKLSSQKLAGTIGLGASLDRNLVHVIVHPTDRQWLLSPYLRSCQACFALGFHSIFHQVTSITKCPIHHENLLAAICEVCGSHELYDCMGAVVGKYGGGPHTCAKCGNKLWKPYDNSGDLPHRNLLSITPEQKATLDDLYDWFTASARLAPYGANLKRWEAMAEMLTSSAPLGLIPHKKSIYNIRGHEIQIFRGHITGLRPPNSLSCSLRSDMSCSITQYGLKVRNPRYDNQPMGREPQYSHIGLTCLDTDEAQGFQTNLRQIYKSIRRHIAKNFLKNNVHRRCANSIERAMWWEPTANSDSRICPWAFAYLFWRRNWEKRIRANSITKYADWKNFLLIKISDDDPAKNEWITLRIFALECYWTFQESVLLARGMHRRQKFSWDLALIRGRLIPYWHIDNQADPINPVMRWWARQPIHSKALKLKESIKRHRKDVAEQAKTIYWLPVR